MHGTAAADRLRSSQDAPKKGKIERGRTHRVGSRRPKLLFRKQGAKAGTPSTVAESSNIGLGQHQATAIFRVCDCCCVPTRKISTDGPAHAAAVTLAPPAALVTPKLLAEQRGAQCVGSSSGACVSLQICRHESCPREQQQQAPTIPSHRTHTKRATPHLARGCNRKAAGRGSTY